MKEFYTKPMSQIDEFKTYDEVLTTSLNLPGRDDGDAGVE